MNKINGFDTLFITGNGFDIAHGLGTQYSKFREYLIAAYKCPPVNFMIYDSTVLPDGSEWIDPQYSAWVVLESVDSIDCDWSNFEKLLEYIDICRTYIDDLEKPLDREGDFDHFAAADLYEDSAKSLKMAFKGLPDLLNEWLSNLDKDNLYKKFNLQNLLDGETGFLSYNYTDTLESLYNFNNVTHIHGELGDSGENIVVGSGNRIYEGEEYFNEAFIGAGEYINDIHSSLFKDAKHHLNKHKSFFQKITHKTKRILSYGFSMGESDIIYLEYICSQLFDSSVWYVSEYEYRNKENFDKLSKQLRNCGFKGGIGYFVPEEGNLVLLEE
jgi:hypothetical protein